MTKINEKKHKLIWKKMKEYIFKEYYQTSFKHSIIREQLILVLVRIYIFLFYLSF